MGIRDVTAAEVLIGAMSGAALGIGLWLATAWLIYGLARVQQVLAFFNPSAEWDGIRGPETLALAVGVAVGFRASVVLKRKIFGSP